MISAMAPKPFTFPRIVRSPRTTVAAWTWRFVAADTIAMKNATAHGRSARPPETSIASATTSLRANASVRPRQSFEEVRPCYLHRLLERRVEAGRGAQAPCSGTPTIRSTSSSRSMYVKLVRENSVD